MYMNWVEQIRPKSVEVVKETSDYGKFNIEPLERGFGTTLGNALRRVLLSSVRGAAITAVRIEGARQEKVQHEFQTIPGVLEDVSGLILNLKQLALRMDAEGTHTMSINAKGPKTVTGRDIEHGPEIRVISEDAVIATLGKNAELHMEMIVNKGFGYVPSTKNKSEDAPVDQIAIDITHGY
jgi:DNA-directed RNA polymerase subunit alpha